MIHDTECPMSGPDDPQVIRPCLCPQRKVRVSRGLFEALADRVEWGEPDPEGYYTPALYRETREDGWFTDHVCRGVERAVVRGPDGDATCPVCGEWFRSSVSWKEVTAQ